MTNPNPNRSRRSNPAANPRPEDVRALRGELSRPQAALLTCTSVRSWEEWEAGRQRMHPMMWVGIKAMLSPRSFRSKHRALA